DPAQHRMILLLDTHVILSVMSRNLEKDYPQFVDTIRSPLTYNRASVVSLWEIAIKIRIGKLQSRIPLEEMASTLRLQHVAILMLRPEHAVAEPTPSPPTRDPFDRLLLAQAQIEGMRFVTVDRALADHPVTFR
ncbi:MAG: type II toxin-antitoxin system VapC family toxin, partial [Beijerinckiaceae bacterium]